MKITRTTWYLLTVMVMLLILTWYLEWSPAHRVQLTPTLTPNPALLAGWINPDIDYLEAVYQGNQIAIERGPDRLWRFTNSPKNNISQGKVEMLLSHLTTINAANTAGDQPPSTFGLDQPAAVIKIRSRTGKTAVIKFGSPTPIGSGYYLQIDEQATIIIGRKYAVEAILELIQEKAITSPEPTAASGP